jgi:LacI family transcriptional regulator, galactose operon repressor
MVTIKDIARALGVSPSTVTRALAGNPRISAATIRRVRERAEAMGYVADSSARAMQSGTSSLVGLLMPDIQNNFYSTMARAAAQHCLSQGLQLVLCVTEDDPKLEEEQIRALVGARCAGALIVPTARMSSASQGLLSNMANVQLVRRSGSLQSSGFGFDDRKALSTACGYLLDLGHRRIGLLVGDAELDTAQARRAGYLDAYDARGLDSNPNLIKPGPPRTRHGREATVQLLQGSDTPTAIIAAGSALTEGMLDAVADQHDDRLTDLSLLGFGDNPAFRWWRGGGLTTVSLPLEDIVSAACNRLFELIKNRSSEQSECSFTAFETGLILRGSARPETADLTP